MYCFNINFDTSQLKHNGFKVEKNKWYDVSVLARMCANERMKDGEGFGLAEIALRLLGIRSKGDVIRDLCQEYKVKGRAIAKGKLYSVKGLTYNPKFKEYALGDLDLTLKVLNYF